jgi:hypothetical protein
MAQLPLNTFKTKATRLGSNSGTAATVYTAPIGVTSIVLMAQLANLDSTSTHYVTFSHFRNRPILADAQGNGGQPAKTTSTLVLNYGIPANDAGNPLSGKLIIEQLDSIQAYAETSGTIQLVLSILETANS